MKLSSRQGATVPVQSLQDIFLDRIIKYVNTGALIGVLADDARDLVQAFMYGFGVHSCSVSCGVNASFRPYLFGSVKMDENSAALDFRLDL